MFIANERRLSRSASRRQSRWDVEARPPRNWRKALRLTLYTLLGLLGSLAVLASVSLMLQRHRPASAPAPLAEATPPSLPAAPAPTPTLVPPVASTPPPASADGPALRALQEQMRDAATVLADLRRQADQLRQGIADVARARVAADEAANKARQAQQAVERDRAAQQGQAKTQADWADAERTVRTLAQQRPPPPPPAAAPTPRAPPPQPAQAAPEALADATPASAPRPRVALRYQSGSAAAMQAANDIAQRLLFSDFTYTDTRSAPDAPANPVIRYFHPEDAAAAQRLADWLGTGGARFRVQDASARAGRAPPVGTLDVWIGG
jgi:hypothetical protein